MDNDLMPTLAFELRDKDHERSVRAFLEAVPVDYYFVAGPATSYGVIVVHSDDMVKLGQLLVPRS